MGQAGQLDYSFSYSATSGPIQSFSFSFLEPTFVTGGTSPAFTPFVVTDGANTWTMTNDLTYSDSTSGCFMFGNPSEILGVGGLFGSSGCVINPTGPGPDPEGFFFATSGGLPSAPGIYPASDATGLFVLPTGGFEQIVSTEAGSVIGTMNLTITELPEPSTLGLAAIGLFGFVFYGVTGLSKSPRNIAPAA
jgi:hypothetical protein